MTQDAFKAWWYNEGSQTPYTHHDCEEHTMRMCEIAWNKAQALAQPEQEPVAIDQATMELAESVGLIGPTSRTHDLHQAIQRFHDLICVNATVKAAQMAADVIRESTPPQPERHELQAKGEHPAPCARHCEANAFKIVIKNLKAQLAQPKQEPVAHTLNCVCGAVWDIKADGSEEMVHTPDITPPQRKPLTDEMKKQMRESCDSHEMRGAFVDGWLSAEAAHGIWPENSDCHGPDWTDRDGEYLK